MAVKLVSPSVDGLPDRLILLPGGKAGFVELKAKGKKPRALQVKRMNDLRALGFTVFVVDDKERIGGVLHAIQTT
ncbi:VRR-NUC domain-containing protein [Megasphaera hutchinsoni]|nr:VRR-NUC domain-containing protein [Megasphaera hutchinsoni]